MSPIMHRSLPAPLEESHEYHDMNSSKMGNRDFAIHKNRKVTSTGGGRAWSEEEESYLLRTRMNKMPYKHIAAHLHKTELACRLHYHQMSYSSSRRKRTSSMSSTGSAVSYAPPSMLGETTTDHHHFTLSPVASPPSSPESICRLAPYNASPEPQQKTHIPILPKPFASEPRQLLPSVEMNKPLRLDTGFLKKVAHSASGSQQVDPTRLRSLYSAHRTAFWNGIAAQYSVESPFTAAELEEAFFSSLKADSVVQGRSPPTPGASPQTLYYPTFSVPIHTAMEPRALRELSTSPVNTAMSAPCPQSGRCAVSALLNDSK